MCDVIVDTDCEAVECIRCCKEVINSLCMAWCEVLGGQTVAAADDLDAGSAFCVESCHNIEEERLAE